MRYKRTGLRNPLFFWGLSPTCVGLRYKRTSPHTWSIYRKPVSRSWAPGPGSLLKTEPILTMNKLIPDASRLRRIPSQFSWVDHRLVRHRLLSGCHCESWALYLLLLSVGDADGISYYSDKSLSSHLGVSTPVVGAARQELCEAGLIAWQEPFYQVLDVSAAVTTRALKGGAL